MPTTRRPDPKEPAPVRCIRCAQEAPPAFPGGFLCGPCEEALGGEKTRPRRGAVREHARARGKHPATAPSPGNAPAQEGAPPDLAAVLLEVEELRRENALLTRGANLLLGSVAEDLPAPRAMAIVAWEREWRLHRLHRARRAGQDEGAPPGGEWTTPGQPGDT